MATTYSIELEPDQSGGRELRISGASYAEIRAMAKGLSGYYSKGVRVTMYSCQSETEEVFHESMWPEQEIKRSIEKISASESL